MGQVTTSGNAGAGAGGLPTVFDVPVAEAVAIGDLACYFEGVGFGKWKQPSALRFGSLSTPFAAVETANTMRGVATVASAAAALTSIGRLSCAALADGSFVLAWVDNGNTPKVAQFNALGVVTTSPTSVAAVTASYISVSAMADGGYVIAYADSGADGIKWARYEANGNRTANGSTAMNGGAARVAVAGLSDGGFVIAAVMASTPKFSRYTSLNVETQANITAEATNTTPIHVCALVGGGFVICYNLAAANPRFVRYDAAGVVQGAATSVEVVTATEMSACGLQDGGFVIAYSVASLAKTRLGRYNAAGALQGAATSTLLANASCVTASGLPDGGFAIATSAMSFVRHSAAGVGLGGITVVGTGGASTSLSALADGGIVFMFLETTTNYPSFARFSAAPIFVAGVYTSAAAAGAQASVDTYGVQTTTVNFAVAGSFNHQAGNAPGNKGALFGTTAYLKGLG